MSVAERYVELINTGRYAELGALFAERGVFCNPTPERIEGASAIGTHFVAHLSARRPTMRVARQVVTAEECWAEMERLDPDTGDFELVSANHFSLDADGLVTQLVVFLRPR